MSKLSGEFNNLGKGEKLVIESNGKYKVMDDRGRIVRKGNLYYEPDLVNEFNKGYNLPPVLRSSSNLDDKFVNLSYKDDYLPEEFYSIFLIGKEDCFISEFNRVIYFCYVHPDECNRVDYTAYFSYPKFELKFITNCNNGVVYRVKKDRRK